MSFEIEAKFMEVNINELRKKLKKNNAKKIHKMVLYKRYVFNLLNNEHGYIRTRDENGRVTITLKKYIKNSKFPLEYEILLDKTSTIEDAKNLLLAQGYTIKAYHETLREKWSIKGCPEIAIDTLPGIPTYVELDCKNENEIKRISKLLGFDMKDAKYGPYVNQYIDYYNINIDNNEYPILTFQNIDKQLNPNKNLKSFLINMKKNNLELIKKNKINLSN
jgi:adenylate cyclase class IV